MLADLDPVGGGPGGGGGSGIPGSHLEVECSRERLAEDGVTGSADTARRAAGGLESPKLVVSISTGRDVLTARGLGL